MAHTYLKLADVDGPINASGSTAVPSSQPAGFDLRGVFAVEYSVTAVSIPTGVFAGAGPAFGKATPTEMQVMVAGSVLDPDIWLAAAKATVFSRACVIVGANATGGIATEWVRAYYLLRKVLITSHRTITGDDGNVAHELGLSFTAMFSAWFAAPAGGSLGTRTQQGWDYAANALWTP